MSVILIEKDPFVELLSSGMVQNGSGGNVRRPLYGISVKANRFAFMSVWQAGADGASVPISLLDSSAPGGHSTANHNFLLQTVQESRQERAQIVETFGDPYVFFYGDKPIVLQCGGVLINTRDFNWKNEWLSNYDKFLRGTKCVEYRARVYLGFDDVLVEGYMLNTSIGLSAQDMPYLCPFSFGFLVSRYTDLSRSLNDVVTSANCKDVVNGGRIGARMTSDWRVVEYLEAPAPAGWNVIEETTGQITTHANNAINNGDTPESVQDGSRNSHSASWVTGGRSTRQWKTADQALLDVDRDLTAQQTGQDAVTVRRAQLSQGASFPLGSRSASSSSLAASLTTGVANGALVVGDAPVV